MLMKQYVLGCQIIPFGWRVNWQFIQLLSWQEEGNGDISKWLKKIQSSFTYLNAQNKIIEILAFKSVSILVVFIFYCIIRYSL